MFDKISKISFCTLFLLTLIVPLVTTNLKKNTISTAENRTLAQMPSIYTDYNGVINENFYTEFENWINDNIGFRSELVRANAEIQYNVFDVLANSSDMYLGPKGEINYATLSMLTDYQHKNLYSEEDLTQIANGFRKLNDYLENKNIQLYYYQCWDKHSIYPEYFPNTVIQYGDKSKTDQIVEALENKTSINVISPKETLIKEKENFTTYSKYGDATHWTQRGAYCGYRELMNAINANNDNVYKVLEEDDYNISLTDQGVTLFGGIHKRDMLENFSIINPAAEIQNERLTLYADDERHSYRVNESVNNNTRLLIMGDSYFDIFIVDDIAESFHETIMIWGDYDSDIFSVIDEYNPDIVIVENAERCDRSTAFINSVNNYQNYKKILTDERLV